MLEAVRVLESVVGLGLLIFLHELGHFLMAKKNRVRVEIFSLGFGKALFSWRRGETEYRISLVPLGGYVKMAGEAPLEGRRGAPDELSSKSAWQRFQIFAAGAAMNLAVGIPLGILAYLAGKFEFSNEVGAPGVPETRAGMKPGDEIVRVGGRTIESMDKYRIEMVRRLHGTVVPVTVRRDGREIVLEVEARGAVWHGFTKPRSTMIGYVRPGSLAAAAGLRELDEVIQADGQPMFSWRQLEEVLSGSPGRPVLLTVRRRDARWTARLEEVTLVPPPREFYGLPRDDRLLEALVGGVSEGMPAWGRLRPGDRILRIDDREIRCWQDLRDAVEGAVGRPLRFWVRREERVLEEPLEIIPAYGDRGKGQIGVIQGHGRVFALVEPDSPFGRAGLRSGDELYSLPRKDPKGNWQEDVTGTGDRDLPVSSLFGFREKEPRTIRIQVKRGGEKVRIEIPLERRVEGNLDALGLVTPKGELGLDLVRAFRRRPPGEAVAAGLYEPVDVAVMTFEIIAKLLSAQESVKGLTGPVGIFSTSMRYVELSFGNFLWLLCLITVNLGIFNLLPIPILDGGQVVLLAVEKIRGRPPSERFLAAFQYAGLLFILGLVVLVTYNDISRLIGGG